MAHYGTVCHKTFYIFKGYEMVVFRDVREYKCSTCNHWFKDSDKTQFLKIFSNHSKKPETVAVFCSEDCKLSFASNLFPVANNHYKAVSC